MLTMKRGMSKAKKLNGRHGTKNKGGGGGTSVYEPCRIPSIDGLKRVFGVLYVRLRWVCGFSSNRIIIIMLMTY